MYGLAGLVILVLDIIAIVDCLKSNADTVKKLLWILLILFLPSRRHAPVLPDRAQQMRPV
jgi:hypothetical protein